MQLLGYITHRDEDGTWYLETVFKDGNGYCYSQNPKDGMLFHPSDAIPIMEKLEEKGKFKVRYTASLQR